MATAISSRHVAQPAFRKANDIADVHDGLGIDFLTLLTKCWTFADFVGIPPVAQWTRHRHTEPWIASWSPAGVIASPPITIATRLLHNAVDQGRLYPPRRAPVDPRICDPLPRACPEKGRRRDMPNSLSLSLSVPLSLYLSLSLSLSLPRPLPLPPHLPLWLGAGRLAA